jgi:hypothetical protein
VPVVFTGTTPRPDLPDAEPAVSFLRKPYRIAELIEQLRNVMASGEDSRTEVAEAASE